MATAKKKVKRKGSKDPNAPKRGMSAFMFFSNAMRPKIKADNPDMAFGDIAREIGKKFKELNDEEKEEWEAKAAKDKARYEAEMAEYSAPEGDSDDSDGGGKKAVKDPNAPKKPMSAYMQYSVANRGRIKEENPTAAFGDIVSSIAVRLFCD